MRRIVAVATKELHQILRDRRTLGILLLFPAFILLIYGYALNFDIRDVRLAVQDRDRSTASRELVSAFVNSGYFSLVGYVDADADLDTLVDTNQARAVLVDAGTVRARRADPDAGDGAGRHRWRQREHGVHRDGLRAGHRRGVLDRRWCFAPRRLPAHGGALLTLEPRIWYNPQLRSTLFLVPGPHRLHLDDHRGRVHGPLGRPRERAGDDGADQDVANRAADVHPRQDGSLPRLVVRVGAAHRVHGAQLLFDLPMRGSWVLLCGSILLFLVGAQAQGLLISTIATSQQVAFQVALLSSFLPTFILSGFIFPISSMPIVVQGVSHIVPARYFLVALRAIVLKGAGLAGVLGTAGVPGRVRHGGARPGVAAPEAGMGLARVHETRHFTS